MRAVITHSSLIDELGVDPLQWDFFSWLVVGHTEIVISSDLRFESGSNITRCMDKDTNFGQYTGAHEVCPVIFKWLAIVYYQLK